jgi:hypothetical protein
MALEEIDILIKERYESAKRLAKELWLDGDHEGNDNDFYYFQCGFVAGMNYKDYTELRCNNCYKTIDSYFYRNFCKSCYDKGVR